MRFVFSNFIYVKLCYTGQKHELFQQNHSTISPRIHNKNDDNNNNNNNNNNNKDFYNRDCVLDVYLSSIRPSTQHSFNNGS